jgi:hypothetical protein
MRGYREPYPEDDSGVVFRFEDQFEHDGFGLTFRKFGRGRPVRVTPEERDECIARFERLNAYLTKASFAVFIAWFLGAIWWDLDDAWSNAFWIGGLIATVLALRTLSHVLWSKVTGHFARRVPVGPKRTLIDQYRTKAAGLSWANAGFAVFAGVIMLWLTDFDRPWRFLESAQAGVALAGLLGLALLKVLDRQH